VSAFIVRGPIAGQRMVCVERVDHHSYLVPEIDVTLEQARVSWSHPKQCEAATGKTDTVKKSTEAADIWTSLAM